MPQFFLSRAAGDDDSYALRFFRDLSAEVGRLAGVDSGVGFVDAIDAGDIESGSLWTPAAREALASCRVFVALCSPRYFLSERCGREWWIFAERVRRFEQATGRRAPALIPVLWTGPGATTAGTDTAPVPTTDTAPVRSADSGSGTGIGTGTGTEAIRQLIRLRSLQPRYQAYVAELARQIVAYAEAYEIPDGRDLGFGEVPNAFDPGPTDPPTAPVLTPSPRDLAEAATQRVHFVVAAGTRAEMSAVRGDLRFYGDRGRDWAPYHPTLAGPLVTHARAVAAERLFGSDVADLGDLAARVDQASRNNEIVVLVVDSWVTKLSAYQHTLAEFDRRSGATVAVLAPGSATDPETARHSGELRSELTNTFRRNLARPDQLVRIEIDSAESFDVDLAAVLEEAQNRIFSRGTVFRRPANDEPTGRPILQGP